MDTNLRRHLLRVATVLLIACGQPSAFAATWGANYFPNVSLVTQDGARVRFFDDLIENKIVAINFIFTSCADTCPLETAQLVQVQDILGDRLGADIHFYTITIDPEHDTPEVLKAYRERFGARWTFLTGSESDVVLLRRKLGLYIEEIQDGSNNHNVSMIIGNQATGRWMKRSPFENPYVLADQLGNWLADWRPPPQGKDYATAPELRDLAPGEQIFRTRCAACHSLTGNEPSGALGPDLIGVTERRDLQWLLEWLRAPDQVLARRDPIAMALYEEYDRLAMPNARLNKEEALALIAYFEAETERLAATSRDGEAKGLTKVSYRLAQSGAGDVVAVMDAWVRTAVAGGKANAGFMTLVNVGSQDVILADVESRAFRGVEIHEMTMTDGLMKMREVPDLVIPASGQVRLEPGGLHLMLMGPTREIVAGQTLEITLTFQSGRRQTVPLKVVDP